MSSDLPARPCLLAFDTSTEQLALALVAPTGVFTHRAAGGALASAHLLPQAFALLQQAGLAMSSVQAVAFGRGPGAFTGLRTSCAVAQGLAFGLACPVLPLDSLLLVAEDAFATTRTAARTAARSAGHAAAQGGEDGADWTIAMDARMDEAYAARYRRVAGHWQVVEAPALYTLPALAEAWARCPPARVAGSALLAFAGRLPFPPAAVCVAQEANRAAALASLALAAWSAGGAVDPASALPVYLRDKVALTTDERAAVRDAARAAP